jgi:hypothetical protein
MSRCVSGLLGVALILVAAGRATTEERKHSGTVVAIDPRGRTLAIDEMGPWTPERSSLVRRTIVLGPGADVRIVGRAPIGPQAPSPEPGEWPGGFKAAPFNPTDIRPGDFVTMMTGERVGRLVARDVSVVRPDSDAGAASPALGESAQPPK